MRLILTPIAEEQLAALLYEIAVYSGWARSMKIEESLNKGFDEIAATPGIGHLRDDLIPRQVYFHYVDPYQILFIHDLLRVTVIAIIHGARDIEALTRHDFD